MKWLLSGNYDQEGGASRIWLTATGRLSSSLPSAILCHSDGEFRPDYLD
jgi:hypothetical protein